MTDRKKGMSGGRHRRTLFRWLINCLMMTWIIASMQMSVFANEKQDDIATFIENMTLEEKVAQLFVITPEALTKVDGVTQAGEITKAAINDFPVGGIILFENNIISEEQCKEMTSNLQAFSSERTGLPLLICTDEEGGRVTRIANRGFENVPDIAPMNTLTDETEAFCIGISMGQYLSDFGINVDFAPVADILSNPENTLIQGRAFGSDAGEASRMMVRVIEGLHGSSVMATLKHFPGHGDTSEDSHSGRASSYKTLDELRDCELLPFKAGIEAGAELVMIGHISLPVILESDVPASVSPEIVTGLLREELGFDGVVVTDALNMGAIQYYYTSAEAAVLVLQAGADLILMPVDFEAAYYGVLDAVRDGTISEDRIDESVSRIVKLKQKLQY